MALIAEDGDRLIAVGRYDRSPDQSDAEVAFVVADEYQASRDRHFAPGRAGYCRPGTRGLLPS